MLQRWRDVDDDDDDDDDDVDGRLARRLPTIRPVAIAGGGGGDATVRDGATRQRGCGRSTLSAKRKAFTTSRCTRSTCVTRVGHRRHWSTAVTWRGAQLIIEKVFADVEPAFVQVVFLVVVVVVVVGDGRAGGRRGRSGELWTVGAFRMSLSS